MIDLCICGHTYMEHDVDNVAQACRVVGCWCDGYKEKSVSDQTDNVPLQRGTLMGGNEEAMSNKKKPLNHPDYECWPGGPLNLSKWSRENEPKPPHRFKIGDVVRLTVPCEVTALTKDCDGTPLYSLSIGPHGWGEERLEPATEEEKRNR